MINRDAPKGTVVTFFHPVREILVRGVLMSRTWYGWWVEMEDFGSGAVANGLGYHIGASDLNWRLWLTATA